MNDIEEFISFIEKDKIEYKNAIKDFNDLPYDSKIDVLNYFVRALEKNKWKLSYKKAVETCKESGHKYDKWEEESWNLTKTSKKLFPNNEYSFNYKIWNRTCIRCGFVETVNTEPIELLEERLSSERKEKLLFLERK